MNLLRPKRPRLKLDTEAYKRLHTQVLDRDGWRCQDCGSSNNLQVHHQRARSKLGHDDMQNLITLCVGCHELRHRWNT
jgi:5-methylcytosine-specific restriction endonuclease McrA